MAKSCISKEKIEAACYSAALSLGYSSLKDEQREIIVSFVARSEMFLQYSQLVMEKTFIALVYPAYLINFLILQILLSPQPMQYVAIFNL